MNIAYIVIDTLRYDYIGANGNDWIETPNIDRFASKAWAYDRAFCASFPTIPYRTDVITGQYGAPLPRLEAAPARTSNLTLDTRTKRIRHTTHPRYTASCQRRTQF